MAEAVKQRLDHDQDEEEEEEEEEEEFLESDSFSSDSDDGELRSKVSSTGPLYQLTSLKEQLPIKRSGLSKYYQGKSQSYTSLTAVRSVEDLRKKENPFNEMRKMKTCKSYAGLAPSLASCASSLMSGSGRHLCKN